MISRRTFVFDCSAAAAAFIGVPAGFGLSAAEANPVPAPDRLGYAAFAAQVDTRFRIRLPSGQVVDLKLIKARLAPRSQFTTSRRPPPDADYEKFSLIFTGPRHSPLSSAIHSCEHRRLGRFEIHLGEIGAREGVGLRYEAVFNQPAAMPHHASLT